MMTVTPECKELVDALYKEYTETNTLEDPCDLLDLISAMDFRFDECASHSKIYWEFICNVVDNISTGKWRYLPESWVPMLDAYPEKCTAREIEALQCEFQSKVDTLCETLKLPKREASKGRIMYHWVTRPNGLHDMLRAAKVLIDINSKFN